MVRSPLDLSHCRFSSINNEKNILYSDIIRREFVESTVITVAHRLDSIIDSDKIMVMDAGQIAEFDKPRSLLLVNLFNLFR